MRDTADWYGAFARGEAPTRSAVYEDWASGIARDPALIALIDELPETVRQPSHVFAVARLMGAPERDFATMKAWMLENWPKARREISARLNQANEPARCASLLPALASVPGPLALLEIGTSGGLCLYPDRYSYVYDDGEAIDPDDGRSAVVLRCETTGSVPLPSRLPTVVWRAGIDLAPLDVSNADDRNWLATLAWPEEKERRERIVAATEIARRDPPSLFAGDAADRVADVAALAPSNATLVVVTSGVLVYLPFRERERFCQLLRALAHDVGARWLSLEGIDVLPVVKQALPTRDGRFVVALDEHPLAFSGPLGQSLDWLPAA